MVSMTVVNEVLCYVTAMAVDNEKPVVPPAPRLLFCTAVKNLLQPYQTNVVIAPT
jgi:hypothetical protein